jgi:serine/threonine protein phosphatase PrpC
MFVDLQLLLQAARAALVNQQGQYAQWLLDYAIILAADTSTPPTPFPYEVALALDRGLVREANEDCVLALHGIRSQTQDAFGFFVVCDGMGGHINGLQAAHLAVQTTCEALLPHLIDDGFLTHEQWRQVLVDAVQQANRAIFRRNQSLRHSSGEGPYAQRQISTSQTSLMGTTLAAALCLGETAYLVNVGDSRIYRYTPAQGLTRETHDHSVVAALLANRLITEEEVYTHPQRNRITRSLGTNALVEVDSFEVPLQADTILLLCSDGLWEATRDHCLEAVLATPGATASFMTRQCIQLAKQGGGKDNVSCIVAQMQRRTHDISTLTTTILDPVNSLNRVVASS